jgi:preprotein translocase subunit SecE
MNPMKWFTKTKEFVAEVRSEMKKCSFPTREEVVGTTIVVIITSVVFAIFLWAADLVILKGYQSILKAFNS